MLGLAIVKLLVGGDLDVDVAQSGVVDAERGEASSADAGLYRGTGWYSAGSVPEPPYALGLVIVAAAGMRSRERRRLGRAAAEHPGGASR